MKQKTKQTEEYILTPKNDVIFRMLFGKKGNENILKDFLEGILEREIKSVEIGKDTILLPDIIGEKTGILDIRASLEDGTKIDIEMQNINSGNIEKRMTYYLSKLYTKDLKKGQDYSELNQVIGIAILDFNYFKNIKEHHTVWKMTEQKYKKEMIEEQEMHFIELPKFLKSEINVKRKLDQWLLFLDQSKKELVNMAKKENNKVEEASAEYEYLTGEEEIERLAFLRMKYELDHNSGMSYAKKQGEEIGMKRGMKVGKEEGMKVGREEGMKEGMRAGILKTAREMKKEGIDISLIMKITGISEEEIKKL